MTGYASGSDMLLYIGTKAIGHCTSHTATFSTETKDRAVKPAASAHPSAGLWKDKAITGLSISVNADGLVFYGDTEYSFISALNSWKAGTPVTIKCMRRSESAQDTPAAWLEGSFIITSLERTDPASDDVTYRISLENNGQPTTLDETKIETGSNVGGGSSNQGSV